MSIIQEVSRYIISSDGRGGGPRAETGFSSSLALSSSLAPSPSRGSPPHRTSSTDTISPDSTVTPEAPAASPKDDIVIMVKTTIYNETTPSGSVHTQKGRIMLYACDICNQVANDVVKSVNATVLSYIQGI